MFQCHPRQSEELCSEKVLVLHITCDAPPYHLSQRKEHHDGSLFDVLEISLHQEHLGGIQLLARVCPNIRILSLQANHITRIEDFKRFKVTRNYLRCLRDACQASGNRPQR